MSDAFAYLSVLLSIILGLAMAEILQGYGSLLLSRGRVTLYAPPLIWSAMMLILAVHFWWASFGLAQRETWNFAAFTAVLLQTVMMYMGSALVLPKARPDQNIDLKAHYYREATPFFSFGLLFLASGFVKDWLLARQIRDDGLAFFGFFATMTLIAVFVRKPRVHEVLAPVMALGILIFIAQLFSRLKTGQ